MSSMESAGAVSQQVNTNFVSEVNAPKEKTTSFGKDKSYKKNISTEDKETALIVDNWTRESGVRWVDDLNKPICKYNQDPDRKKIEEIIQDIKKIFKSKNPDYTKLYNLLKNIPGFLENMKGVEEKKEIDNCLTNYVVIKGKKFKDGCYFIYRIMDDINHASINIKNKNFMLKLAIYERFDGMSGSINFQIKNIKKLNIASAPIKDNKSCDFVREKIKTVRFGSSSKDHHLKKNEVNIKMYESGKSDYISTEEGYYNEWNEFSELS